MAQTMLDIQYKIVTAMYLKQSGWVKKNGVGANMQSSRLIYQLIALVLETQMVLPAIVFFLVSLALKRKIMRSLHRVK